MSPDADNWWRVERTMRRTTRDMKFAKAVEEFLRKETYFPDSFDDSPLPSALEYLTAWRRL